MKKLKDPESVPSCVHSDVTNGPLASIETLERASALFRALGDTPRLRMLCLLIQGERCVGELVEQLNEKFSTVSQRLRILRVEGLVKRRRAKSHVHYSLADQHVADLVRNALEHAEEG